MVISYLKRRVLARFLRDQDGSASIEAVIMMPMVFWVYLAMFTFFQTYQEYYTNQKAAYTIGDMISRDLLTALSGRATACQVENTHCFVRQAAFVDEQEAAGSAGL